jgi:hypothetical protein
MPQAGPDKDVFRLQVEVEPGSVDVSPVVVSELRSGVCLVWALVPGEPHVPENPEHGASGWARVGDEAGTDGGEGIGKVSDEPEQRLLDIVPITILVRLKPLSVVVQLESGQESEEFGCEVRLHHAKTSTAAYARDRSRVAAMVAGGGRALRSDPTLVVRAVGVSSRRVSATRRPLQTRPRDSRSHLRGRRAIRGRPPRPRSGLAGWRPSR